MWVDKDDVFAEDKVREFKASNPEAETHIRTSIVAKSPHPHPPNLSQLLHTHALQYMSSDGNNDLAQEYSAGAIADSPISFLQEFPIDTPVTIPVPIVDFATLQNLNPTATVFNPRPVVTDLQGPPSERTQTDKIRDLKSLAKQYARDQGSCDDTRISYLEFVEAEAEADLMLARMIAG
jgi:hypothetical protein